MTGSAIPELGQPPEPLGLIRALSAHPEQMADLIEGLHSPAVDTGSLLDLMSRIGERAVQLFDGIGWSGVTGHFDTLPVTLASTDHRVLIVDSQQFADGDGPSQRAVTSGHTVAMNFARMSQVWPALARTAQLIGIRTVVSVPLRVGGRPVAALNLYSAGDQTRTPDPDFLTIFAYYAQRGLTNFHTAQPPRDTGRLLRAALAQRELIAQATGLLMQVYGFSADYAGEVLRDQAQDWHRTPSEQATHILGNHVPPAQNN